MTNVIPALAVRQWRDYRARQPGTCFAEPDFAMDLLDAYGLQDAVTALRITAGDCLAGYKVGCTGPGTVQQFGMEGPIRGCLFESEVRQHQCTVSGNEFANLAIEGEMAARIGADGTISAVFPVIELHHFVFRGARKTLPELVANNGLNGGIVLPAEDWLLSQAYIERQGELSVWINDQRIASGELWPIQAACMRRSDGFASTWPRRAGRCFRDKSSWLGRYLVSIRSGLGIALLFALTTGSESNAKFYDFALRFGLILVASPGTGSQRGWCSFRVPVAQRTESNASRAVGESD